MKELWRCCVDWQRKILGPDNNWKNALFPCQNGTVAHEKTAPSQYSDVQAGLMRWLLECNAPRSRTSRKLKGRFDLWLPNGTMRLHGSRFSTTWENMSLSDAMRRRTKVGETRCGSVGKRNRCCLAGWDSRLAVSEYTAIGCETSWTRRHDCDWQNRQINKEKTRAEISVMINEMQAPPGGAIGGLIRDSKEREKRSSP